MGENSKIAWCQHTINFWWGCDKVHEGCANCYAEAWSKRWGLKLWGPDSVRRRITEAIPLADKLGKKAAKAGRTDLVFSNSMSDFFEQHDGPVVQGKDKQDGTPLRLWKFEGGYKEKRITADIGGLDPVTLADLRGEAWDCIDRNQNLIFMLLTKRPQNIPGMLPEHIDSGEGIEGRLTRCVRNVWLGTSISLQAHADKQVPELLKCHDLAPVRFLSCEPMLGPIRFCKCWLSDNTLSDNRCRNCGLICISGGFINWVIIGCESIGPRAGRLGQFKTEAGWLEAAESLVSQCRAAGVPCFVKQIPINGRVVHDISRFPESLRVQEFPASRT